MEGLTSKDKVSSEIQVALSVYDPKGSYARHAGVVLSSVLNNTYAPVSFHILHDDTLTLDNQAKLQKIIDCSNQHGSPDNINKIVFVNVTNYFDKIANVNMDELCGRFSRATLYRLVLPEILIDLKEVLYLDCDIVVSLNISELWKTHPHKECRALAGVLEDRGLPFPEDVPRDVIKVNEIGLSKEHYVNAGVLIMNLEKIREESVVKGTLLNRAFRYINAYNPALLDQDFLNAEYLGDIIYVESKYNTDPTDKKYEDPFTIEKIWHFGGHIKPWVAFTGTNIDILYWTYFSKTPWNEDLVVSIFNAATNEKYYHRHSSSCILRLKKQLKANFRRGCKIDYC